MSYPAANPILFAIGFAATLIVPPLIGGGGFPPYPDLHWQDVIDLATPVVMAPLYWLLVRQPGSAPALDRGGLLVFLVLIAVWVEAQGMHLAANSIDNRIAGDPSAPAAGLVHYYDEVLSHYLWHAATVGLSALALVRQWYYPLPGHWANVAVPAAAGLLYGFTFFVIVVEGATAPLGIPAAILLVALAAWRSRSRLAMEPISTFTLTGYACALVFIAAWAAIHGGDLPGFYETGIV